MGYKSEQSDPITRAQREKQHTKFKVWVKVYGDPKYYTNAKEFNTREDADAWGANLLTRWTLSEAFKVKESIHETNG